MIKQLTYIFFIAVLTVACNTQKVTKVDDKDAEILSASSKIIQQTLNKKSSFKDLTIKSKLTANIEDLSGDINATIVVKN